VLVADPNTGYAFERWSGGVTDPGAANTTVAMDGDKSITAHFVPIAVPNCTPIVQGVFDSTQDARFWRQAGGVPAWRILTATSAPDAPHNPQPDDGAAKQPESIRLVWEASDADGDTLSFLVAFGTSNPPPLVASCATAAYDPSPLLDGTTYYWQIAASDGSSTTSGPVWRFTTRFYSYLPILLKR
jgi:hypothetical protein